MIRIISILLVLFLFLSARSAFATDIITDKKLITVDIGKQMLYAWERGKIIYETKISSGLPKKPTVKGSFKIRVKVAKQTMKGQSKEYGKYEYKNVPHVMYFYQDYAIHGAYWHNKFGRPNSHGCVNVPVAASEWLYNWAEKGTRVEVF